MADLLTGLPPVLVHQGTAATTIDMVTFWIVIGVIVTLVVLTTIALVIAGNRSVKRQAQMKEAEQRYEVSIQPQGGVQPQVQTPEEEKILLPV
jgi:hypothetical protein